MPVLKLMNVWNVAGAGVGQFYKRCPLDQHLTSVRWGDETRGVPRKKKGGAAAAGADKVARSGNRFDHCCFVSMSLPNGAPRLPWCASALRALSGAPPCPRVVKSCRPSSPHCTSKAKAVRRSSAAPPWGRQRAWPHLAHSDAHGARCAAQASST